MLEYTLDELVGKVGNRYALVAILAKRSRQVVEELDLDDEIQINPVSIAASDLMHNQIEWVEGTDKTE